MTIKQQVQVNRIQAARPDVTFTVTESDDKVYLNAENFPKITIGKNAGIQVDLPSYPDPFEAAIYGDELLANKKKLDARMIDEGSPVDAKNVWLIAERIVANELERRGFLVTILKTGAPNADLKAERDGRVWRIQVKGTCQSKTRNGWQDWWVGYGTCNSDIIEGRQSMFNRVGRAPKAEIVVLVAVRTRTEYRCVILPVADAEKAAQISLDTFYRTLTRDGNPCKPAKVSAYLDPKPNYLKRYPLLVNEWKILQTYEDNWNI